MNVTAHQEKKKKNETKTGKRRIGKKKNRRPILKKLCATILRSCRGKHIEKVKGIAQGNWDPLKGQQLFRPNSNGVGGRTNTFRRLLIGADEHISCYALTLALVMTAKVCREAKCKPGALHHCCEQKQKPCVFSLLLSLLWKTTRIEVGVGRGRKE